MTKNIISNAFVFSLFTLLIACSGTTDSREIAKIPTEKSFRNYYYPIEKFKEPKVYHYSLIDGKKGDLYWVFSTLKEKGKTFLITDSYGTDSIGNITHIEVIKEEINDEGSFVREYTEFQRDGKGNEFQVEATMKSSCVFKWNLKKNEPFDWIWLSESKIYPGYFVTKKRHRQYTGEEVKIEFKGQEINAIKFSDSFEINYINSSINDNQKLDFPQTSLYAENIGMIKYTRELDDGLWIYNLIDILSIEEWETIKNE